jgi:hypothetical protein
VRTLAPVLVVHGDDLDGTRSQPDLAAYLNPRIRPWQHAAKAGMWFACHWDRHPMYVQILPDGPDDAHYSPFYVRVRAYGAQHPNGVVGAIHRANLDQEITADVVDIARAHHYPPIVHLLGKGAFKHPAVVRAVPAPDGHLIVTPMPSTPKGKGKVTVPYTNVDYVYE